MATKLYYEMFDASAKVKRPTMKIDILNLLESGRVNADETIYGERASPEGEWEVIFKGSIASLLACEAHEAVVVNFFGRYGVKA